MAVIAVGSARGDDAAAYRMIFSGENTRLFRSGRELDFSMCLQEQLRFYPEMENRDILKLIFQASFGAKHALENKSAARRWFFREFAGVEARSGRIFEVISPDICRVDLRAWKAACLPGEWLFNMFMAGAETFSGSKELFEANLLQAQKILPAEKFAGLQALLRGYDGKSVHHSERYRKLYKPAYRIVSTRFITAFPVLLAAVKLPEKPVRVIVIDGRAASGKSTLARQLAQIMGSGTVHLDDFFLPPALRKKERLAQPGGNVHYERFRSEVLPFLRSGKEFSYRIFDCKRLDYHGERKVAASAWRIVEGAYAMHPVFGDYADLKVFFDINPDEQLQRIRQRNGEAAAKVFASRWIPMEENHIRQHRVMERADLILGRQ